MKKQINEEIIRIKEVMRINEAIPIDPLIAISQRISRALSNVDLTKNANLKIANQKFEAAVRSGVKKDYFDSLSEMFDELPSLYDNSIKQLLLDHNKVLIDNLETVVNLKLADGINKDTIKTLVRNYIRDEITKDFPYARFSENLTNKFDDTINNYVRRVNPLNPSLNPGGLKKLFDNFPALQTFLRMVSRLLKSEKELLDEFLTYQDQAFAKLQLNQTPSYELKKMADILMSTRNLKNVESKRVWEGMKDALAGAPGWKDRISSDVANELEKAFSDSNPQNWSYVMDAITKSDTKLLSNWNALLQIYKTSDNRIERIRNFVSFGDARTKSEILTVLQKKGVGGYFKARVLTYFIYMPTFITALTIAFHGLLLKSVENIGSKFGSERDFTDWGDGETLMEDLFKIFKDSFPGDTAGEAILAFLTPTMVDDIWGWVTSVFIPGNIFLSEEEIEKKQSEVLNDVDELDSEDKEDIRNVLVNDSESEESEGTTETQNTVNQEISKKEIKNYFIDKEDEAYYNDNIKLIKPLKDNVYRIVFSDNEYMDIKKDGSEWVRATGSKTGVPIFEYYINSKNISGLPKNEFEKTNNKMNKLNESIRKKLTSKYIDKANKSIKITENLEKVSDDFYTKNYTNFFDRMFVLSESYRNSKIYLTESTEGSFEIAFTKLFKGDEQKVKKKLLGYVRSQFKLTDEMKSYMEQEMSNIDANEISQYFTNPSKLTDLIADAVVNSTTTSDSEDEISSIVQNVAIPYFNTVDFKESLKKKLKTKVSEKVDDVKLKVEDMLRKIVKAVAEKED